MVYPKRAKTCTLYFPICKKLSVSSKEREPLFLPLSCVKPVIRVAPETAVRHGGG